MSATEKNPRRPLLVKKFGGTSVANIERIREVARLALESQRAGNDVVVVVSAMSGETNRLLGLAHQVLPLPDARELDVIAATGEQVSTALTSGLEAALVGFSINAFSQATHHRPAGFCQGPANGAGHGGSVP